MRLLIQLQLQVITWNSKKKLWHLMRLFLCLLALLPACWIYFLRRRTQFRDRGRPSIAALVFGKMLQDSQFEAREANDLSYVVRGSFPRIVFWSYHGFANIGSLSIFCFDSDILCLSETWLSSVPATPSWLLQHGLFILVATRLGKFGRASGGLVPSEGFCKVRRSFYGYYCWSY